MELINGSYYCDLGNGTTLIALPLRLQSFSTVVDGSSMSEATEPYTMTYTVIQNGTVTSTKTVQGSDALSTRFIRRRDYSEWGPRSGGGDGHDHHPSTASSASVATSSATLTTSSSRAASSALSTTYLVAGIVVVVIIVVAIVILARRRTTNPLQLPSRVRTPPRSSRT